MYKLQLPAQRCIPLHYECIPYHVPAVYLLQEVKSTQGCKARLFETLSKLAKQSKELERCFFKYEGKTLRLVEHELEQQRRETEEEHELCVQQLFMQSMP